MRSTRGGGKKTPELMDPERERDPHRILALFAPYRVRLAAVHGPDRVRGRGWA